MYKKMKKDKTSQPYEIGVFTKKDIVRMIADDLQIDAKIVNSIITRMTDIVVELVANHNMVRIPSFFTIEPKIIFSSNSYRRIDGLDGVNGAHVELRVRPSKVMKELHKLQQQVFHDTPYVITRDSWRGARKWWLEYVESSKEERDRLAKEGNESVDLKEKFIKDSGDDNNPFLNDDED